MAIIKDERANKSAVGYVVFTDTFMSGWGDAKGGIALYALAVSGGPLTSEECRTVMANGRARGEMKNARYVRHIGRVRLGSNDHLTIADRTIAPRWYQPNAFGK